MKAIRYILVSVLLVSPVAAQVRPWQTISDPTAAEAAAKVRLAAGGVQFAVRLGL